jgi:cytochrome c
MRRSLSLPVAALAFLVCVAFAVVGGLLVLHGSDDQANHVTVDGTRIALTKQEALGHEIFAEHCASCHQLAASNSIGQVGPNLDSVSPTVAEVENVINNGQSGGNYGEMPAGLATGPDIAAVAAYVHRVANHKYYTP